MSQDDRVSPDAAVGSDMKVRNPFGVMDVPDPDGRDVEEFAAGAVVDGRADDENASAWCAPDRGDASGTIGGAWCSRWNGGADPTIPGDTEREWKQGESDVRVSGDRIYLLFDWDNGKRKGLIDARRAEAGRLVGKYLNLTSPQIVRPWIGLIVDNRRIDGRFPEGRLDFRR